ncbi:MAG: S8 family serine peptidase [Chloroflexota bacterium]
MNKKIFFVLVLVVGLMIATTSGSFAKQASDSIGGIIDFVSAGGGSLHFVPTVKLEPFNFSDYPDAFEYGIATWDNDVIDTEKVAEGIDGAGVYVAVLDTGLAANWRDYFPEERIAVELGRGFTDSGVMREDKTGVYEANVVESNNFIGEHPHGTHVSSTVIGYSFYGTPVPGVAPMATIIPVKVLTTYPGLKATFGTDAAVAAGIEYIGDLAAAMPESSFVINMSLGSLSIITDIEADAIDYAISQGVIIVASAGNNGTAGMGSPGSYAPVISVGATGWAFDGATCSGEWVAVIEGGCYLTGGFWDEDVMEDNSAYVSYVTDFSSRENPGNPDLGAQELDVLAPGSWVVGPYPLGVGQSHLPWWSQGVGNGVAGQYYFVGGTSMASPHVAGVAALLMQADPSLTQGDVEALLRATTDAIPFAGWAYVADPGLGITVVEWGYDGLDAVGYGLVQADAAVDGALTP